MSARVAAVVVTYQPQAMAAEGLRALLPQVECLLVVDNGSDPDLLGPMRAAAGNRAEFLLLGRNLGVASGHNTGIARAKALGMTHVLLMDQDSVPAQDMVARLLEAESAMANSGERVGAVGPVYHDARLGKSWPFYRLTRAGMRACTCVADEVMPCDFLISSGTLARIEVLDAIGGMKEGYFLEHVDTEWTLRARARGYRIFGACAARMNHELGDDAVRVPLMNRSVQLYRPYRHYYLFRNAVLLAREPHAPFAWKLNEVQRLLKRLVFFPLFVPPRFDRLRYMLLGLWHGMRGRDGPL